MGWGKSWSVDSHTTLTHQVLCLIWAQIVEPQSNYNSNINKSPDRWTTGDPVVRTCAPNAGGMSSLPSQGTYIRHAADAAKKKKKKITDHHMNIVMEKSEIL